MPITKFKITQLPKRASLKIESKDVVLDQEYSILKQDDFDILVSGVGKPYDEFKYKLGNENGNWSNDITATINVDTDTGTPASTAVLSSIANKVETDITSDFVYDAKTDRVKITINGTYSNSYAKLLVNGIEIVNEAEFFLYEINDIKAYIDVFDVQNAITYYKIAYGNENGYSAFANITMVCSANMWSDIDLDATMGSTVSGTLTTV